MPLLTRIKVRQGYALIIARIPMERDFIKETV